MLGLYVSDHPLLGLEHVLSANTDCTIGQLMLDEERADGSYGHDLRPGHRVQRKITKRGDAWAMVTLEDLDGAIDVLLFPSSYQLASTLLVEDAILTVKGRLSRDKDQPEIHGQEVSAPGPLRRGHRAGDDQPARRPGARRRWWPSSRTSSATHPGVTEVRLRLLTREKTTVMRLDDRLRVTPEPGAVRRPQAAAGSRMSDGLTLATHHYADPPGPHAVVDVGARAGAGAVAVFAGAGVGGGYAWRHLWTPPAGVAVRGTWVPTPVEAGPAERLLRRRPGTSSSRWRSGWCSGLVTALVLDRVRAGRRSASRSSGSALAAYLMLSAGERLSPPDPDEVAATAAGRRRDPRRPRVRRAGRRSSAAPSGALAALGAVYLLTERRGRRDEVGAAAYDASDPTRADGTRG